MAINLTWDNTLKTGIEEIDDHNKEIVALAEISEREYLNEINCGSSFCKEAFFISSIALIIDHFEFEEKLALQYSDQITVNKHKQMHDNCIRDIKKFAKDDINGLLHFTLYIHDWIIKHIMVHDRQLFNSKRM